VFAGFGEAHKNASPALLNNRRYHPSTGHQGCEAMKKPTRQLKIKPGPLVLFLIFCIIGGVIGIAINNRYYAVQRGEFNPAVGEERP
jgi:hypothetical protein